MAALTLKKSGCVLSRYWRIAMTGLCFFFFGIGGIFLSLVWFNFLRIFIRDADKRKKFARGSISACFRFFIKSAQILGVFSYQVHGRDVLLKDRGCLLLANHPTLLDYVFLAAIVPDLDCVVKAGLLKNPFLAGVVKAADYLINDEDPKIFMQQCKERLEKGGVLLIFPEGTRTRHLVPVKPQRGAANIALRSQRDMRLIKITCTPLVVTKETKWYQAPLVKPIFKIEVQNIIRVADFLPSGQPDDTTHLPVAARRLTDYLAVILAQFKIDNFGSSSHG